MGSPSRRDPPRDLPATICPLPWVNLSLDVDGSSRPCCKFAHLDEASPYQLANLRDATLPGIWNSPAMQGLRTDLRAGAKPTECSTCWDEEAAGVPSWRQTFLVDRGLEVDIDYDDPVPGQPVALDLKLSNTCNLRCRICSPVASSAWLAEEVEARGADADQWLVENRSWFKARKLIGDEEGLGALGAWVDGLQHIEMTGGEPMLSLENRRLLELICVHGRPERVALHITTNATVIDDRTVSLFGRFRRVGVVLSVDDIGPRLSYQRAPAGWATVQETVARWARLPDVDGLAVNCSVSVFNVWHLSEVLDWFTVHHPTMALHLNIVHNPGGLSVRSLPPALGASVTDRLRAYADDPNRPDDLRRQVGDLIVFIGQGGGDGASWSATLREIHERDRVRDERFADVYPELWSEIERLGLDGEADGRRPGEVVVGIVRRLTARLSA